ncbi:MAG: IclR family transcriptional regulator C-terminal domain-containing protein [Pigmentiphaga sp.]|uniref:IclR family transcriptional regulator n=1 Tax=Pigmentiphaga sp. TaxID=1977564 RepID=UPI0029A35697|nr:IclR family transcriptional regulator C-terminal domain-containing protein [Pigmentiphaga sp.]MDX3905777.1 IclR family transcriptional regulator C-terminal domain-containing protein [Pigmentiphaga sp.]
MEEKSATSLERLLRVLDLFDDEHLTRTAEEIATLLDVSLPTGYRYVKTLGDAGLLQRAGDSRYALGPRIVVLDYYIRRADPLLRVAIPHMAELVEKTSFDCVTSAWFGSQILDTHREMGKVPAALAYGRGRPRPLFSGGAPKVILASFPPAQLRRLFDAHPDEIARAGLPTDWPAFRKYYAAIRKAGYYVSMGELEAQLAAIAAPIPKAEGGVWGALSLVIDMPRVEVVDMPKVVQLVRRTAARIADELARPLAAAAAADAA